MAKCSFCGYNIEEGTGIMIAQNSGKILYFDSKKCEKNMLKLNRKARKLKWTKFYEKHQDKKETTS
ncbi:MAG: 50S ribosomal protein L24e [Candidatus Woesearchaeota archaeon]|nr:MAG: 50S ribosomal protein L24e [Candidatus Woesearchaeota archaeon]